MDKKQKKQPFFCLIVTKNGCFFRYISNIKYTIFHALFYSKYEILRGSRSELTIKEDKQKKPHKREEPVECGFHRRVMKKSLFIKQVFLVYVYSIRKSYEVSL